MSGSSRSAVQLTMRAEGTLDMIEPGRTRWVSLRLAGPSPEAAITRIEARVQFDPVMLHPVSARADQGVLRAFQFAGDTASVVIDLTGTPDTARTFAAIEFMGLYTDHDTGIVAITRADFGVASANPSSCYFTTAVEGVSGSISICGPPGSGNVHYLGMALDAFPNPAQGWISMATRAPGDGVVEIINVLGSAVARFAVTRGDAVNTIDTHAWNAGVYSALLRCGVAEVRRVVNVVR